MAPKLPKEYTDFRREQILLAAWECFGDKGYSQTTVREIAKRMNASTGVIYNFFKGKEEILGAIQKWSIKNNTLIFNQMEQKDSAREAILEFFKINFECGPIEEVTKSIRGNISVTSEALMKENIRAMFNSSYKFMEENISGFFKEGIEKKEINPNIDPKALAGFFIALLLGLQLQLALLDGFDASTYIENIKKILFANVWSPPAAKIEKRSKDK